MASVQIRDGFTLTATVPAKYGWPAVTFVYRPALPERVMDYFAQTDAARTGREKMKAVRALIVEHVRSWDVDELGKDAEPAGVTPEAVGRLPLAVLNRIVDHVTGFGPDQLADAVGN